MLEKLYNEMVAEFRYKLGRELTKKELELLQWVKEKQFEVIFKNMKSS